MCISMVIRGASKGCANTSSTALNASMVEERCFPSILPKELSGVEVKECSREWRQASGEGKVYQSDCFIGGKK